MANPEEALLLEDLPFSLDAEQAVLGGMLIDPDCIPVVLEQLSTPQMFYRKQHAGLFEVFLNMSNLNKTIDFITVLDEVQRAGVFADAEEAKVYLAQLMEIVPSTANIVDYCAIIQDRYYRRRLIQTSKEIESYARDRDGTSAALLDLAEQRIYDIRQNKDASGLQPIGDLIVETYDHLQKLTGEDKELYLGLSSGFSALDTMLTGLNRSDLILLAARPGMGKTSFALNIAVNVAKKYADKSVAIFNLEMSAEQLVGRILSSEAQIPSRALRTGIMEQTEWGQLAACADILSRTHIYVDDTAGINATEIKAKARRLPNLGLIVIDYLQLMESGGRAENRVQEVSKITRSLKIMAKELDVPVIVLSQLNRSVEARTDHKPMLADLRESGSIEQDADSVIFLTREGYYDKECETPYLTVCTVAKNRHGSTGDINLRWDGEFTRFSNLEMELEPPPF
jgi:replicative DNA helicase